MKVSLAVARVFGTDDQYGDNPRTRPPNAPLIYRDFPFEGYSVTVDFGPVPTRVIEAERMRRAIGTTMLRTFVGPADNERLGQQLVDDAFAAIDPGELFGNYNWYSSFLLEREIEVEDPEYPVDFVATANLFDLDKAAEEAAPALDTIVALVSTVLDPGIFQRLVLDDHVLLFAEGKRPSGVPRIHFSAAGFSVRRGGDALKRLGDRLDTLQVVEPGVLSAASWLARIAHWRVQTLLERDEWKRFQWSFLALEILVNKLFELRRDDVLARLRLFDQDGVAAGADLPLDELVWQPDRAPLRSRFAVVACDLFPDSASEHVSRFARAKEARDRMAHGAIRDPAELPIADLQALLSEYLRGAVERLLLRASA